MSNIDLIKQVTDRLIGKGELDVIETHFSAGYLAHAGERTYEGRKFIRQFAGQVRKSIPDMKVLKVEILSQTENTVAWQRTFSGTHKGNMRGIPASMKKVKWYEMVVTRFEDGKIAEEWVSSDLAFQLMLKQPKHA